MNTIRNYAYILSLWIRKVFSKLCTFFGENKRTILLFQVSMESKGSMREVLNEFLELSLRCIENTEIIEELSCMSVSNVKIKLETVERKFVMSDEKVYTFSDCQMVNISNDLVLKYPNSILNANLIDLDSRSSEKEIEIDFRLKYLNELLSYMNYELNIWTLNGVEFEEFCTELMEMRIPFRMDIMNRLYNGFNECGVGWKNRCVVVNGKEYRMMFDCIKWKLSELRYNEERERIECIIDRQYESIIQSFSKYLDDQSKDEEICSSIDRKLLNSLLDEYSLDMNNRNVQDFFYPIYSPFLKESIINEEQYDAILREWIGNYQWKLIYRASEHGYTAESFHEYCDDKRPTLVIIKSTDGWIFGGYATKSWYGYCIYYYYY